MATSTMTTKGQVTIPRTVREQLGLREGVRLEFFVEADGTLRVRPLKASVSDLFGVLERQRESAPTSIEGMNDSIRQQLVEEDERIRGEES